MNSPKIATGAILLTGLLGLTVAACSTRERSDAMPACEGKREDLTLSAPTPLGPSGAELLRYFNERGDGTLTWVDGGSTGLVLEMRSDPDAGASEAAFFTPDHEAAPDCVRHLAIPLVVELTTAGGELSDSWRGDLQVFAPGRATLQADKPAELLQGAAELSRFVPTDAWEPANARLFLTLGFSSGRRTGVLMLESHSEATGSKATVEIARF